MSLFQSLSFVAISTIAIWAVCSAIYFYGRYHDAETKLLEITYRMAVAVEYEAADDERQARHYDKWNLLRELTPMQPTRRVLKH